MLSCEFITLKTLLQWQGDVQTEFERYSCELKKKCAELHAAVSQREAELMARLEKAKSVKMASLNADMDECQQLVEAMESLTGRMNSVVQMENDVDILMNKLEPQEASLRHLLERNDVWEPDVTVSFGAHLSTQAAIDAVMHIQFKEEPPLAPHHPVTMPRTQVPGRPSLIITILTVTSLTLIGGTRNGGAHSTCGRIRVCCSVCSRLRAQR